MSLLWPTHPTLKMRTIKAFPLILCLFAGLSFAATSASPTAQVKSAVNGILRILQDTSLNREARWEKIGVIIKQRFDIEAMAQSILATNWKRATPEEKRDFIEFFSQYLENTYRKKIEAYTDEEVRFLTETIRGERASVETSIVTDTVEIPLVYKLRQSSGEWRAYDVVIEGVSLVANYRNTFAAIVKSEGMDGLLNNLQGSIAKYKAEQAAE